MLAGKIAAYVNERMPLFVDRQQLNPLRTPEDLSPVFAIKGAKYDIPNSEKQTLSELCASDSQWLKDNFEIDYTSRRFDSAREDGTDAIALDKMAIKQLGNALSRINPNIRPLILEFLNRQAFHFESEKDRQRLASCRRTFNDQ